MTAMATATARCENCGDSGVDIYGFECGCPAGEQRLADFDPDGTKQRVAGAFVLGAAITELDKAAATLEYMKLPKGSDWEFALGLIRAAISRARGSAKQLRSELDPSGTATPKASQD